MKTETDAAPTQRSNPGAAADSAQVLETPLRRGPSRLKTIWVLVGADLESIARSWLCRGFLLVSAALTVLTLKGMQSNQEVASQMLEAVYTTYMIVWMHAVIFVAGSALSREQDCLCDAILSRGITRGEYIGSKLVARSLALLLMISLVLVPASYWAIRQDKLLRTEDGFVASHAKNTLVEAWEPKKVFARAGGHILDLSVEQGASVNVGDVLALLDDRELLDDLENERRAEQNARVQVSDSQRRLEESRRAAAQTEEALGRAERALMGKDLMSRVEQADRESDLRSRKRDLKDTETRMRTAEEAVSTMERGVENAQARVLAARKRLGYATITAPVSGFVTELNVQRGQGVAVGSHLLTVAPLDEYQLKVPVYKFDEFKRLKAGLTAYITIRGSEYKGVIERVGPTTQADRWGRQANYVIVRFKGNGTLGLLGLDADVRLVVPPNEAPASRATALLNTLTGRGVDDAITKTASVTPGWMWLALAKVLACVCMVTALALLFAAVSRNALIAILSVTGLWHISNLLFDFVGLRELSYLEVVRTMDKVLGGIASPTDELTAIAWFVGFAVAFGSLTVVAFISRDPIR